VDAVAPAVTIGLAQAENERLLIELERAEGQALFEFVRRLGLSDGEAGDVVQEAFLRLWRQLGTGRAMDNAKGWLYTTVYRLAMDSHRLQRRFRTLAERFDAGGPVPSEEERIAVWAEVDRLPRRQREVVFLRYRSDLPFEQIATVLGISSSAARSHATQAMATLRRRLDDGQGD
jgi:RNA polymerase sigma factor (sigma-70 family)